MWATEAVIVNAVDEMASSYAKMPLVDMRHGSSVELVNVTFDRANAHAGLVTTAEAAHTAIKAPAALSLCAGGEKAACKHCACQNHHHSLSHDILH
jgi:hypothetical protein